MKLSRQRNWALDVRQDSVDITSDRPTPSERWAYTDAMGHEHRYEPGYPTLELVVDAQHWCDGNEGLGDHDSHWAVDESHYECRICREVIEPAMDPPFTPKSIGGSRSAVLTGRRTDGAKITVPLTDWEFERLAEVADDEAEADAVAQGILDGVSSDRITSTEFTTGWWPAR